jgi:hypothetical protein
MLEIAKSNGETSNNNTSLAVITLAISIAKLAAIALIIPIIAAPLRRNAYKAIKSRIASNAS